MSQPRALLDTWLACMHACVCVTTPCCHASCSGLSKWSTVPLVDITIWSLVQDGPGRPHKGLSCGGHPCGATFTPTGVHFSCSVSLVQNQSGCAGAFHKSMGQLAAAASSLLGTPPSGSTTLLCQPQTATTTRSSGKAAHATCTLVGHPQACWIPAWCISWHGCIMTTITRCKIINPSMPCINCRCCTSVSTPGLQAVTLCTRIRLCASMAEGKRFQSFHPLICLGLHTDLEYATAHTQVDGPALVECLLHAVADKLKVS